MLCPKHKAAQVAFSICDRPIAFLALVLAIGILYWTWTGTLNAKEDSFKMLVLQCRNHYEKDPSSQSAIPPKCADVLSAKVQPQMHQSPIRQIKKRGAEYS
jgi:hypothetical protein